MMADVIKSRMLFACICLVLLAGEFTAGAPAYTDLDSLRDLYEYIAQREALNNLGHQLVRKSSRTPSLRLRFGKRFDPSSDMISPDLSLSDDANGGQKLDFN